MDNVKNRTRVDQAKGLLPFLSVFLGACGGGGGGIVRGDPFSATYSGAAVKGPLQNATAFVDYNNDGVLSAGEPSVTTGADGAYSLTATQAAPIVVKTNANTVDTSTGSQIGAGVVLKAPAGSSVVSPATTLVANGATEAQVKAALNLPSGVNLATFNPFAAGADSATALAYEKASVQIFSTVSAIASAAEGAGASQAAAQAAAFKALTSAVSTAAASNTAFNLSDSTAIGQVVTATQTQLAGQINSTAFQAASTQVASAISNINTAVAGLTDLTSSRTLQTISVATKTLGEQVQTAVEGSVANPSQTVQIGLSNSANVESTISAENLAPTDLALSATTILENAANLTIGTISVTDSNTSDTHTFALSGADAALFVLNGTTLSVKASPDYEAKSSYSITITATDSGGKVYSEDFTIAVSDVNETPVLSAPGSKAITEDAAGSTVGGALAATDPESAALTYQVVGGTLASGSYTPTGTYGTLTLNSATGAYSYSLNNSAAATNALAGGASASETFAVRVSDGSNTTASQNLIINITGANDAPSGVTLSASSVVEGSAGATVGTLSATDPEGQTLTYTLGGTDAADFEVVNGTLKLKDGVAADGLAKSSYNLSVTASDGAGGSTTQAFTIAVGHVNAAPVLSAPGSVAITEDAASSTVSGALAATDPESTALTYQLVGGTLASGSYTLTGTYGTLTLNSATGAYSYSLNNSAAATNALAGGASASETFAVRVSDGSNTTASQNLIINITGGNDAPTGLTLSGTSILENSAGATVGTLSATDPEGQSISYSVGGTDAASFEVVNATLKLKDSVSADREAKSSYSLTVTASDGAGGSTSQRFTIAVSDVNETPVLSAPGYKAITEDAASNVVSGALAATDPEGAALTYQVVGGTLASGSYTLTGTYGTLTLNSATGAYSYSLNNSAAATNALAGGASASETFAVRVSDGSNTTASQNLIINITGANDAPVISSGRTASVAENAATSTVVYTPVVTDSDAGDTKTFSLSGPDASSFNINATTGEVTLKSSANYEAKSSYQFIVTVTDAGGKTDAQGVTLSVTNVAENYSGTIVDGYVAGATVFQDLNNNNALDAGEAHATTNALGQFTLTGVVSAPNAPIKMITGFDIGTNEPIVTTLGAPSGVSGAAVASPLSTIVSLASANQPDTTVDNIVSRLGSYLGLSSSTLQTLNLLTDDPIDHLLSTDSAEAAAAKDLFAANQLVMSMSHITGAVTKYVAEQIGTQIQTYLGTQGITNVNALGSMDAYEKIGTDAVFHKIADAIAPSTLVADNTFQLKNSYISLVDYNPETGATSTHRIGLNTTSNVATVGFDNGSLNLQNLTNAVNNSGNYQSPYINFELQKLATGSGSNSVTIKLVDGADGTRSGGEREVGITANLTWTSDGQTATFTLPSQTLSGYYYDRSGNRYDLTLDNVDSDLLSVTSSGVDVPASLNIKLQSLLSKLSSISPGSLLGTGEYHLSVSSTLPLADANGANIDSFAVPIEISSTPSVTVFVPDVTIHEADATKAVQVYLSEARDTDVTISYHLEGGTATSGSDYTATTGTVTITAGLTSATIAVPVLADSTTEGNETVRLVIDSVTGATAMNGYATVTISDAPKATSLYTNLIGTTLDTSIVTAAYQDLAAAIQTKLAATNVTVGGQTQSLATVLSGHVNTASTVTQYQTLGNALTETIWGKLQTVFAAFDGQAGASYGQSLMVANAGAKALDLNQIVGQIMSSAGSYLAGKGAADLNTLMDSYIALATDTVGDIFGVDTATYFSGATVAMLTRGDDTETLSNSSEIVAGLGGNDVVHTLGGNDKYIGGAGVDTVYGGEGNDHLYGYDGNDVLYGEAGNDMLNGGKGNDYLDGGLGNDEIIGGAGNDTIIGGGGSDTISAGSGNDSITVGSTTTAIGNTYVDGGIGSDTLTVAVPYSGVSDISGFTLRSKDSSGVYHFTDGAGGVLSFKSIETLSIGADSFKFVDPVDPTLAVNSQYRGFASMREGGYGMTQGAMLDATNGVVALYSESPNYGYSVFHAPRVAGYSELDGRSLKIYGSSVTDYISGSTASDVIVGGAGNDQINGRGGADSIDGGAGNDVIFVTPATLLASTSIEGGDGSDTLNYGRIHYVPWLNAETDGAITVDMTASFINGKTAAAAHVENIVGSRFNDSIAGDANDNILIGGTGTDTIRGGGGNDTLYGDYDPQDTDAYANYTGLYRDIYTADIQTGATLNDYLYGGAGNDTLVGNEGDDYLDGESGADVLTGGAGADTFVLRAGDGGSVITNADTITDFTDGTDVIGLDGSLQFSDLSIEQGTSAHAADTVIQIRETGEYLAVLSGVNKTTIGFLDFTSLSTSPLRLTGDEGNDVFLGGAGNDTIIGGGGSDTISAGSGNDSITVGSTTTAIGNTYVDGGIGSDTLTVAVPYSGVSDISGFTLRSKDSSGVYHFTDGAGGVLSFKSIETLSIGADSFKFVDPVDPTLAVNSQYRGFASMREGGYGMTQGAMLDATNGVVALYSESPNYGYSVFHAPRVAGYSELDGRSLKIYGSSVTDYISGSTASDVIVGGAGNDQINGRGGADSIDGGAGNDVIFVTPATLLASTSIEGGDGSDTLNYGRIHYVPWLNAETDGAITVDMTASFINGKTAAAAHVENIVGSRFNDSIAGDANDNILIGGTGTDTIRGGGGNDTLYGDYDPQDTDAYANYTGLYRDIYTADIQTGATLNDYLYGGAGNDTLVGNEGDDYLDGESGADVLTGGAGADTFVLRAGDGGSVITNADTITDFTDGTDVIGLDGSLQFSDLSIEQGTSAHAADTVIQIRETGEYLAVLSGVNKTTIGFLDFTSLSTSPLRLTGDEGNDVFLGGAGNDTIIGGGGSDTISAGSGNDSITVGSTTTAIGNTYVDGGIGSDTLTVAVPYSGVSDISGFTLRSKDSSGVYHFTDGAGGVLSFKSIETLSIGADSFKFVDPVDPTLAVNSQYRGFASMREGGYGMTQGAMLDATNGVVALYSESPNYGYSVFHAPRVAGYSELDGRSLKIYGSSVTDYISGSTASDVIVGGAGNDQINGRGGADSIDGGAGNDVIFVTPATLLASTSIEGGDGSDTLNYGRIHYVPWLNAETDGAITVDMTASFINGKTAAAAHVENIVGSRFNDSIAGDANDNILIGGTGTDTIRGGGGNDTLYGDYDPQDTDAYANYTGLYRDIYTADIQTGATLNDYLYGGAGNDTLVGNEGDDYLDGESGADVLTGGAGADTFVLRAGDGGSVITNADTITDFQLGTDVIDLVGGLSFSDLIITQGTGIYAADAIIKTSSGEFLAVLTAISAASLIADSSHFE